MPRKSKDRPSGIPREPLPAGRSITIQLVDDQKLVREGIAALLATVPGFVVVATSSSVDDALRHAAAIEPDVAVLDLVLRGGNSLEIARTIPELSPRTRVVLLDEFPLDVHVRRAQKLGVAGYVTKHDTLPDVERVLRAAAQGERAYSPLVAPDVTGQTVAELPAGDESSAALAKLTPREIEVLVCLAQGLSMKQTAERLHISIHTVDNHKSRMMRKLRVHKTVELTRFAIRHGLVPH